MPALRTIRTVCPRNCYCTCGMLVTLDEGNRIVAIEGDPDNPATGGHVCLKGLCVRPPPDVPRPPADAAAQERVRIGLRADRLGRRARRDHRTAHPCAERARSGGRALLRGVGVARRARRAVDGLLAPVRRLHDDLRRPVLAGRPRGDAPDVRRQPPQPPGAHRPEPPHPALGPQPGGDQRPPVAADPRRPGPGRQGGRHRPSSDRLDRRRGSCIFGRGPAPTRRSRWASRARSWTRASTTRRSSTRTRTGSRSTGSGWPSFPSSASPRSRDSMRRRCGRWRWSTPARSPRCSSPASDCSGIPAPARR